MAQKRKRSPEQTDEPHHDPQPAIFRSSRIEDRKSIFIGLYSPSVKPKELQNLPEIASADHKIVAWRKESNQQSITGAVKYTPGHDDDGEKYGGKKIEKALEKENVAGACVVARWWGGIMLGPARFEHIEACAVSAVKAWRGSVNEERAKKRKAEDEVVEKARLARVLGERDQSITVLRALAAEKEDALKLAKAKESEKKASDGTSANGDVSSQSSKSAASEAKPAPDYSTMPLDSLKKLEKARDATLSFLLKRIDKAEADLVSVKDNG